MKSWFFVSTILFVLASCTSKLDRAKQIIQADQGWLMDDFSLHDTLFVQNLFRDNLFKFYPWNRCEVPSFAEGIPNSNSDAVPYKIWDDDGVKMFFYSDNPWLADTFDIEFTSRKQGMHPFIEMHMRSDSLHYQLSRMK